MLPTASRITGMKVKEHSPVLHQGSKIPERGRTGKDTGKLQGWRKDHSIRTCSTR
jgi:hypothetical protein